MQQASWKVLDCVHFTTKEIGENNGNYLEQNTMPTVCRASSSYNWADSEIRIFLEEWEGVEQSVGNPGRKILEKSWAIRQRINERRGLKKSWESCVILLDTLQTFHRTLCHGRTETLSLLSPYSEALYRILGHFPVPVCGNVYGMPLTSMDHQPSSSDPADCGISVQGIPLSMMSEWESLFSRRETKN